MTTQPEALRLADDLQSGHFEMAMFAAAELRRLHAENERLHQINQSHEIKLSVRGYEIQIDDLRSVNASDTALLRQALDCLENHVMQRTYAGGVVIANTAIALRERLGDNP